MNDNITENLSFNQQQYMETIFSLCTDYEHAHVKSIAERMNISMPSVTEALQGLAKMELINYKARQAVTMTEQGWQIGKELHIRHKVFADFFNDILGLESEHSENIACNIEHVIDDKVRERLSDFILFIGESGNTCAKSIEDFKDRYK
ncbi:MAG: metal-dependent transcriptional regulator [bacterium]|nr:metal-dependent transcriptional regulator [bacterium]